jgi:hypothetical protein
MTDDRRSGYGRRSDDLLVWRVDQLERELAEVFKSRASDYMTVDRLRTEYVPREELQERFLSKDKLANQYVSKKEIELVSDKRARILNLILAIALVVEPFILTAIGQWR